METVPSIFISRLFMSKFPALLFLTRNYILRKQMTQVWGYKQINSMYIKKDQTQSSSRDLSCVSLHLSAML